MKLRAKPNPGGDQPAQPCPPTKLMSPPKRFPLNPQQSFDSPKRSMWESPKSRLFDAGGSSEVLSRICPKQFFDNSQLGATQGEFCPLPASFSLWGGQS